MKKSLLAVLIASTVISAGVNAATTTPSSVASQAQGATSYDLIQDSQIQAIAGLANQGINHTQTNTQAINTVGAQVGQNAQAIGQTNASLGQTNQNLQSLTNNVGQNAQAIGQTNAQVAQNTQNVQQLTQQANTQAQQTGALAGQVAQNTQGVQQNTTNIQNITQQLSGNFVTKPDFTSDQKRQDDALTKETNARHGDVTMLNNRMKDKVDLSAYNIDKAAQKDLDAKQDKALTDGLATKVDQTVYDAGQKKQDDALANAVAKQGLIDKTQDTAIGKAQSAATLAQATATGNSKDIATNKADIAANKTTINDRVTKSDFKADQDRQDKALASGLSQKVDNTTFSQRSSVVDQRFADTDSRIAQQKADQQRTNATVAKHTAQLADHETRITDLENRTNGSFAKLKNEVDHNRKEANAGIAGVAAMANIPQVTDKQQVSFGAGAGARNGESAIAVGFSARVSENVVVKSAVSADTQDGWTMGAGISYGW